MQLSIIIPVLNESNRIEALVDSINLLDSTQKEIIFVDGGSVDDTTMKIELLQAASGNIRVLSNPARFVSQGFNLAFREARGAYISLIGAHAIYPHHYFETCIRHIENGDCDIAGGFLRHQGKGTVGKAIAYAMSTKFGVGNTAFRTSRQKRYVDSVAFAVYHRRVFEEVGLFDPELIRNQDDEFHYRCNQAGLKILLIPELETTYFVRESFSALFNQYFQYGFYKPLVFKKVRSGVQVRHLIPAVFVLYLLTLPVIIWWSVWLWPLVLYFVLTTYFVSISRLPFFSLAAAFAVFPTLHLAYGSGFLAGLWHWRASS
ncbi:MAG: glycosyltransferase family 2 protein [Saprospiraceae bacterium]|nr:glycosyltransferase family 2 protein [Saprospiraceae bacterium]